MTPEELVAHCRGAGVELSAVGGRLKYRAPAGVVDTTLRAALASNKGEVLRLLSPCPECRWPGYDGKCFICHHRPCDSCHRPTGSALMVFCFPCLMTQPDPSGGREP